MSRQIAVRLPDDIVEFLDQAVRDGDGSRAKVVTRALERERRRKRAERDVAILARVTDEDDDLGALARYAAGVCLEDLD
jgi:Arc/MetJ-type ribon-helix-helix transcriptional regulator